MSKWITFDSVMKNHKNWPNDIDFDDMEKCHTKLGNLVDRMFFEEKPRNPQVFVLYFSNEEFVDTFLECLEIVDVTEAVRIWLRELVEEESQQLMNMGVIQSERTPNWIFCKNGNDFFMNLLP